MTSQINYNNIDALYPVAGKDNDSQGFRDNFNAIKSGLATASTEITALQSGTLKAGITNDLLSGSINNGTYNNFYSTSYINSVSGSTNITVTAAPIQVFTMAADITFTFQSWPADTLNGYVKIHLLSNGGEVTTNAGSFIIGKKYTIYSTGTTDFTLIGAANSNPGTVFVCTTSSGAGTGSAKQWREATFLPSDKVVFEGSMSTPIRVNPNTAHTVLEAWSFSNGNKIFIRSLGTY